MKVIFLDVDDVLNSTDSEDHFHCFIGLDYSGIKLLREIVGATKAEIVLVSTWKLYWDKDGSRPNSLGSYLDQRLAEEGLAIMDKTGGTMNERGHGILDWQKTVLRNEYDGKHYCYHFGRITGKYLLYRAAQILQEEINRDNGCLPARLYELDGYNIGSVAYEDAEWINLENIEWNKEN